MLSLVAGILARSVIAETNLKQSRFMAKIVGIDSICLELFGELDGVVQIRKGTDLNGVAHGR